MPLAIRLLCYLMALALLWLAVPALWRVASGVESAASSWVPLLCLLMVLGLLRRVAWGRFLVSCISVLFALHVAAWLIPMGDDLSDGGPMLERLLGFALPGWAYWLLIVLTVTLILLPALAISWRKAWFRSAWW
ncbi:hypothetical protein [Chitinilyticum piscinae]|uniref:Uncharacterized protein n=1 Tax=Chitinilyticum piscinae TaxID=2866724 RepID=A0A8J7FLJ1_9NEIS|nr:hypothetical protein [Chitinilyticum piscinae]MBE9608506.1 hypothetical protein [Chitinilyticum piscinae]